MYLQYTTVPSPHTQTQTLSLPTSILSQEKKGCTHRAVELKEEYQKALENPTEATNKIGVAAGTVTTFYLSSQGRGHDEIDFEFLGNSSGNPYTSHTNVYSQGKGGKLQQIHLWFDPTAAFHTYTIVWNKQRIIFLIDNIPVRVFNNHEASGVPFPMRVYASLWNEDDWATQGGRVKTDWTKAPFTASYRKFNASANKVGPNSKSTSSQNENQAWSTQGIDAAGRNRIRWVQNKHMICDYCNDKKRFTNGPPAECKRSRFH